MGQGRWTCRALWRRSDLTPGVTVRQVLAVDPFPAIWHDRLDGGGRDQVARHAARRSREDPRYFRGLVLGLPPGRAHARATGRGGRDGAPHLQPRWTEDSGDAAP